MGLTVVYEAHPKAVLKVLCLLREQGLAPVALDNPDGVLRRYSGGTILVRIAVPENDIQQATEALTKWEESFEPQASEFQRDINKQILISFVPATVLAIVLLILGKLNLSGLGIVLLVWLLLFPVIGYIYRSTTVPS